MIPIVCLVAAALTTASAIICTRAVRTMRHRLTVAQWHAETAHALLYGTVAYYGMPHPAAQRLKVAMRHLEVTLERRAELEVVEEIAS